MDALSGLIGVTSAELTQLIILSVVLLVGLFLARTILKLTATLFRIGCFFIALIVLAVFVANLLN
jgi:hypothetical protein